MPTQQFDPVALKRVTAVDRPGAACVVTLGHPGSIDCLQASVVGATADRLTPGEAGFLLAHVVEAGLADAGALQRPFVPVLLEDPRNGRHVGAVIRGRAFSFDSSLPGSMGGHWLITLITPTLATAMGERDPDLVPWRAFAKTVFTADAGPFDA